MNRHPVSMTVAANVNILIDLAQSLNIPPSLPVGRLILGLAIEALSEEDTDTLATDPVAKADFHEFVVKFRRSLDGGDGDRNDN